MSKEQDEKRKKERDRILRERAEHFDAIFAMPNEKITREIFESLSTEDLRKLYQSKTGFLPYVNDVLFAVKK